MWNKLNKLSQEKFREDFSTLSEKQMATLINIKKANKIAEEEFGEFGFATCKESEMKKIINANSNLIKNSIKENKNVTKQSILSEVRQFQKIAGLLQENNSDVLSKLQQYISNDYVIDQGSGEEIIDAEMENNAIENEIIEIKDDSYLKYLKGYAQLKTYNDEYAGPGESEEIQLELETLANKLGFTVEQLNNI
jgi:hypothetical protein